MINRDYTAVLLVGCLEYTDLSRWLVEFLLFVDFIPTNIHKAQKKYMECAMSLQPNYRLFSKIV